jgi:hypothetical protein
MEWQYVLISRRINNKSPTDLANTRDLALRKLILEQIIYKRSKNARVLIKLVVNKRLCGFSRVK